MEDLRRSGTADALARVVKIGHNKDAKDCGFCNDQTPHAYLASHIRGQWQIALRNGYACCSQLSSPPGYSYFQSGSWTLEWSTGSPPPDYRNFRVVVFRRRRSSGPL